MNFSAETTERDILTVQGVLCRTLEGHGHWVNTLALSTEYAMRTGAFDPAQATIVPKNSECTGE